MSKINDFKNEVFEKLGKEYEKSISIFEIGEFTRNEKPWFSTFVTDSDQGTLVVFMISTFCYTTSFRMIVIDAIIESSQKYCGLAPSKKRSRKTDSELTERELPSKHTRRVARATTSEKSKKRGRPKGSKNRKS